MVAVLDEDEIQSPSTSTPIPGGDEALLSPSDKKGSSSEPLQWPWVCVNLCFLVSISKINKRTYVRVRPL